MGRRQFTDEEREMLEEIEEVTEPNWGAGDADLQQFEEPKPWRAWFGTEAEGPTEEPTFKQRYGRCEDAPCCGCCGGGQDDNGDDYIVVP